MAELELLVLVYVLVAALAGGMIARLLRLPVILGYLVGGMVVGPYGTGLVKIGELSQIETLAQIGVALLLFTLGMEFSLKTLKKIDRKSVV